MKDNLEKNIPELKKLEKGGTYVLQYKNEVTDTVLLKAIRYFSDCHPDVEILVIGGEAEFVEVESVEAKLVELMVANIAKCGKLRTAIQGVMDKDWKP